MSPCVFGLVCCLALAGVASVVGQGGKSLVVLTTVPSPTFLRFSSHLEPVAISFGRNVPHSGYQDPLSLQEELVDFGNAWSRFGYELTVPNNSVYFFHLNAGANVNEPVNMNLRGTNNYADIFRSMSNNDGVDTIGRDFISQVDAGTKVKVRNDQDFGLYSDVGRQTSFTAFDMDRLLGPSQRKVFSVARRTNFNTTGKVIFDETLVNVGGDFDNVITNSDFTVKRTGLHYFSFSAGVQPGKEMRAQIVSKDLGRLTELWSKRTNHNGTDLVSKCVMADLFAGDAVYIELVDGEMYSDAERQTSFMGFYYDPILGDRHAWSLYSVQSQTAELANLDPFPFNGALVNTGMYDPNIHHVNISQSGLYYVQLNVHAQMGRPVNARVVSAPEYMEFSVDRTDTAHNDHGPLTNGMLLELFEGNFLKVMLGQGSFSYSDSDRLTTFTGFLMYPFPPAYVDQRLAEKEVANQV